MGSLFVWHNLVFYIPLGVGLLLVIGMAVGLADTGHDLGGHGEIGGHGEVGHDAGHDAAHGEHGGSSGPGAILGLLGFGRVPVMILVTTLCLIFGGTGVIANNFLAPLLRASSVFVLFSIAAALVVTSVLTGFVARLVARLLPATETASMSKQDLCGCSGTLILASDTDSGLVQVLRGGDVFQVPCRSSVALPKGSQVLLTDYDEAQRAYSVCLDPTITK
jgi:membrane protein implicated in regulation of membrane protease activity